MPCTLAHHFLTEWNNISLQLINRFFEPHTCGLPKFALLKKFRLEILARTYTRTRIVVDVVIIIFSYIIGIVFVCVTHAFRIVFACVTHA